MKVIPEPQKSAHSQADAVRAFLGLRLSTQCCDRLQKAQQQLALDHAAEPIRWSPRANLHLTILFLGNQQREHLHQLTEVLAQQPGIQAFSLTLNGIGGFPASRSNIIASHIDDSPQLFNLHRHALKIVNGLQIPCDTRTFTPHVTLGRCKNSIGIEKTPFRCTTTASALTLFRSETLAHGPRYTVLAEFAFL